MGKAPFGKWIKNTFDAISEMAKQRHSICASIGLHNWEFPLYCISKCNAYARIYVPDNFGDKDKENLMEEFRLFHENCEFVHIPVGKRKKEWWHRRDRQIFDDADIIYPVAIRPGGKLESLIKQMDYDVKKINNSFRTEYIVPGWHLPQVPDSKEINPALKKFPWNYLTHWTHTAYAPWCNESKYEFYQSVHSNDAEYSHSAYQGLRRILADGKICSTQRKIRGNIDVVSFTEIPPEQAIFFMNWRKGLIRRYWEPYGIAIDREIMLERGVKPVIYGDDELFEQLDNHTIPFFQPIRGKRYIWTEEREWRFLGDFDLPTIPKEKMIIITRTRKEADELHAEFGIKTVGMV